ncbi:DUF262 domain-containing protein [Chromobacterium aquaticum]|uniref:DUF262 domain-containing protein n=1 Tax=Chromobacterium aquaticum TaxID=467180 RepID=A0ABV8ZV26_9NEIS|nr:DUF262 domain-containing protein [Chromobacterium aquaticum]MCD5362568.1 DUF262 domain-containing protein [Chromobacterium aquaticum]
MSAENLVSQIDRERRRVDFDSFDFSVKELVSMAYESVINIAPEYQRQFRWPKENQSTLIESILLGIPVPNLFMAANRDGTWELIDGVQRLSTLISFLGDPEVLAKLGFAEPLRLEGLKILTEFNGFLFVDLPQSVRLKFQLRPLKVTTLSDKSDNKIRFDLFERLNTGGVKLTSQEVRACVFRGEFNDFIYELAKNEDFRVVVNLPESALIDGACEELVLKFFAYLYDAQSFSHSVIDFLNDFMVKASERFDYKSAREVFVLTFSALRRELPEGIKRGSRRLTPINLYEAISVGAAKAVMQGVNICGRNVAIWMNDAELTRLTSGATNSSRRLAARVDYCFERFGGNV